MQLVCIKICDMNAALPTGVVILPNQRLWPEKEKTKQGWTPKIRAQPDSVTKTRKGSDPRNLQRQK
jgi:hypothetical protein